MKGERMAKIAADEPISGIGRAGNDPVLEKLDILIEGQEETKDLLEDLIEKVTDLNFTYRGDVQ